MSMLTRDINPLRWYINEYKELGNGVIAYRSGFAYSTLVGYEVYHITDHPHEEYNSYTSVPMEAHVREEHGPDEKVTRRLRRMAGPNADERWIQASIKAMTEFVYEISGVVWRGRLGGHDPTIEMDGRLIKHLWLGDMTSRRLPAELDALPAGSDERIMAIHTYHCGLQRQAEQFIRDAFPQDFVERVS